MIRKLTLTIFALLCIVTFSCKKDEHKYMNLSTNELVFSIAESQQSLKINTNTKWMILSNNDNLKLSATSGNGSAALSITANDNNSFEDIEGSFEIVSTDADFNQMVKYKIISTAAGVSEVITTPAESNTFKTGEQLLLRTADLPYIDKIVRTNTESTDITSVNHIARYSFIFKEKPTSLEYTIVFPNAGNLSPVVREENAWVENAGTTIVNGAASIKLKNVYSTIVTRSTPDVAATVALLDKTKFYKSHTLIKDFYNANPLSAIGTFEYNSPVTTQLIIKGQNDNDIVKDFASPASLIDTIPVIGLYNDYDNQVQFRITNQAGTTFMLKESMYCNAPYFRDITVQTSFENGFRNDNDELYLAISSTAVRENGFQPVTKDAIMATLYDQWGKIRGIYPSQKTANLYTFVLNGQTVIATIPEGTKTVNIFSLSGKLKSSVTINDPSFTNFHHDLIHIEGNTFAVAYAENVHDERGILEFDIQTGQVLNKIDLATIVTGTRRIMETGVPAVDVIHVNSIFYLAKEQSFVISCRHQGIVKVARASHQLKWILTPHLNLSTPGSDLDISSKVLSPENFENKNENWNIGQHSATVMKNGNILCFDNHNEPLMGANDVDRYSRLVAFDVNEENMTVRKTFNFSTTDKKFSWYMGSAYEVANGNVLGTWATDQFAVEVNPATNKMMWSASFMPKYTRGDLYRTYKINVY